MNLETLKYLIDSHKFMWVEIVDNDSNRIFYKNFELEKKDYSSDLMYKEVLNFITNYQLPIYNLSFKTSANVGKEQAFNYKYKPENTNVQGFNKSLNSDFDLQKIRKEIKEEVETEIKKKEFEDNLKLEKKEFEEEKKSLETASGKASFLAFKIIDRLIDNYQPGFEDLIDKLFTKKTGNLAGINNNDNKISVEMTEEDKKKIEKATENFLKVFTQKQYIEFSEYILENPKIASKIDLIKNLF